MRFESASFQWVVATMFLLVSARRTATAFVLPKHRHSACGLFSTTAADAPPMAPATYPFADVEPKWQAFWEENNTFKTPERDMNKPKKYVLDMFPYPSGAGLHVGHPEGYTGEIRFCKESVLVGMEIFVRVTSHPCGSFLKLLILWPATGA
jgi:hypothetical protein